jgi:tetratricopeptide (TPR) repeat protein
VIRPATAAILIRVPRHSPCCAARRLGIMTLPAVEHLVTLDLAQRMVPVDAAALRAAVGQLRVVEPADDRELFVLSRRLGFALIALGEYADAVDALARAVTVAVRLGDAGAEVAARINLGDAHRYAGRLGPGAEQYVRALSLARAHVPARVDFALQHLGKHHIDAGEPDLARACLTEALRLRRAKGDAGLIASTSAALKLLDV